MNGSLTQLMHLAFPVMSAELLVDKEIFSDRPRRS